MTVICYRCLLAHPLAARVTCTDCKACAGKPAGTCLRKRCPGCNAGTYLRA